MKRLLLAIILLLFAASFVCAQKPTATLVFSVACANSSSLSGSPWSATPIYQCNLPQTSVAGGTLLVGFGFDNTGGNQVFTVTDDGGDTFTLDVSSATSNNKQLRIYQAKNIAAGSHFVQVTLTGGSLNGFWQPTIAEFYNAATLDGSSCNTGTSATITAGSITPSQSGDLFYQLSYFPTGTSSTPAQTASYTAGSQSNITWALAWQLLGDGAAAQYGTYSSSAALNPTFTSAASAAFISCSVALKASLTNGVAAFEPPALPFVASQMHDAMPKNHPSTWNIGTVATSKTVYMSYMGNDSVSTVTSSPSPTVVNWTASGPDFSGLNGHNHAMFFCAQFSSPPGPLVISLTTSSTTNDSINQIYSILGGSCIGDGDATAANVSSNAGNPQSLTTCTNCLTPTAVNDIILMEEGQAFCTATGMSSPTGANFDSGYFQGNNVSGPSQTDENNFWAHYFNANLNPITVTQTDACPGTSIGNWAARVSAWKSATTLTAATNGATDVQNAVNSAETGQIVIVPSGSPNWSGTAISIPSTAGITVQASGTVTVSSGGFLLNQNSNWTSRVTGFTLSTNGGCGGTVSIRTSGSSASAPYRIDHNVITQSSTSPVICLGSTDGPSVGLFDHNTVHGVFAGEMLHLNDSSGATQATSYALDLVPGSWQMTYIEDNTFDCPSCSGGNAYAMAEEAFNGSDFVFRHNQQNGACNDIHNGTNGGRWWELYNNVYNVILSAQYCFLDARGGSGVVFNNTSVTPTAQHLRFGPLCGSSDTCTGTYPLQYQLGRGFNGTTYSPSYVWGNDTFMTSSVEDSDNGQTLVAVGASSTGCSLHGTTCDVISVTSQPATLLECAAAADVTAGCPVSRSYSPFTYPHPLQNSAGTPTASFSPGSLSFGNHLVNTQSPPQNLTLTNTGTAVLNISSVSVVGTNASSFSQNNTCGASLGVGNSCTIAVSFIPVTPGSLTASVVVSSNDPNSPTSAALAGFGLTAIISGTGSISGSATIKINP